MGRWKSVNLACSRPWAPTTNNKDAEKSPHQKNDKGNALTVADPR